MILSMKNFKCFKDAKFLFSDRKMTLITAPSGCGKTSIFEAIMFVLWGEKIPDQTSYNKKKSEVILEYESFIFKRTKNPSSFSVMSTKYGPIENPQEFVDNKFKKYPLKFFSSSAQKQMKLFEEISCNNFDIENVKENIKTKLHEGSDKLKDLKVENEVCIRLIKELSNLIKDIKIPEKPLLTESQCRSQIFLLEKEKELMIKEDAEYKFHEQNKKNLEFIVCNFVGDESKESEIRKIIFDIQDKISRKLFLEKQVHPVAGNLEEIKLELNNINLRLSEMEMQINHDRRLQNTINEKLRSCQEKIVQSDLENYIENVSEKGEFTCPVCKTELSLDKNTMELKKIKQPEDVTVVLECIDLKKKIYNTKEVDFKLLKQKRDNLKVAEELKNIDFFLSKYNLEESKNQLRKICEYKEAKNFLLKINSNQCVSREIDILRVSEHLNSLRDCLRNILNFENLYKDWETNEINKNKLSEYKSKKQSIENELNSQLQLTENLETLLKCIDEAQSSSIVSIIKQVNKLIHNFTELFFDSEIFVTLQEYHQVQSTKVFKPQIDIIIKYKGQIVKPHSLSSGELARVELAVDLAIYQLMKSNAPLLLDEVAANLDSESSSKMFLLIKEVFSNDTVIVIAHQAVEGLFDYIINENVLNSAQKV